MPTSRHFVKRDLDQALTHLARIQKYLIRSGALYEAAHPLVYKMFCVLVVIAAQLEAGLKDLKKHL